ncbi:unnamed protein product [Schistocephalus solidus]|uniref:RING-type domain-containing protein n=1 Tax=Schistocephalus solidus TaxID=70667 RepID=A0A183SK38_SCHSO|nr:unnamed protein product [Schistocephalus solidus]
MCLGEYTAGDRVRHMPCGHLFHVKCVDTWLHSADTCPKCREYTAGDRVRHLPCGHLFHVKCVDTWLHSADTCPKCRKNIIFGLRRLHTQHMREQRARTQSLTLARLPQANQNTPAETSSAATAHVLVVFEYNANDSVCKPTEKADGLTQLGWETCFDQQAHGASEQEAIPPNALQYPPQPVGGTTKTGGLETTAFTYHSQPSGSTASRDVQAGACQAYSNSNQPENIPVEWSTVGDSGAQRPSRAASWRGNGTQVSR